MRSVFVLTATMLLASAPAAGQATGKYAFQAGTDDGSSIPGSIEITGSGPTYGGWIRWTAGQGPDSAAITKVVQQGSDVTVIGDNPAGQWTIHMTFAADSFRGTYEGPASGPIHGRRAISLDVTGVYDFQAGVPGGNKVGGRLVIRETAGQFSGTVAPDGGDQGQITRLTSQGSDVTIEATTTSNATVVLKLQARGDSLVGNYRVTAGGDDAGDFRAGRIRR
jgi:hypothetical protein